MSRRLTEFLLSDIVAISADAIICIDDEHRITLFNGGAEKIFGWTADEVMGKPLDMLLPERARKAHPKHIQGFRDSPEHARKMGERREIAGVRKSGEEFPAEAAIAKVKMGETVVFSVVLRDITDQVALQKRLQRAVSARDETIGTVAHDLRNPLSAIKMLSRALLTGDSRSALPPDAVANLSLINEASEQMDKLIQDLLDITRAEAGQLHVLPQVSEVPSLVEQSLATLRPLVEQAELKLEVHMARNLPAVSADVARVRQVLSNLIGNAIKFTPGGGTITVTAALDRGEDFVQFRVADTGSGIAPEQLSNVFDRFFQTPSAIRVRGAGLGLPIARAIVNAHGGMMTVDSTLGAGTTFAFTLPVAK